MNVAIIGIGLLGASLGMALRGKGFRRIGWTRREAVSRWSVENDVLDHTGPVEEILAEADLTVLCLPIPAIMQFMQQYASCWRQNAVVTDIGSVKSCIEAAAARAFAGRGIRFVGSHPMAGTENSGPEAAFPALYADAETFICPGALSDEAAVTAVEAFWRSAGTRTRQLDVVTHDRVVAHTSHISHLLASALTTTVLDCDSPQELALRYTGCATGFRDTSRIASSSPVMWREIIEHNATAVVDAARRFEDRFRALRECIERGDFDEFEARFAHGKELRDGWIHYKMEMSNPKS